MKSDLNCSITVIFATYNRAEAVRETLDSFSALDRDGLDVRIVVVANNCSDQTLSVLADFTSKIPLVVLEEPLPGKNIALNTALDTLELGDLVVFCDDDISPNPDWLQQIARASAQNSQSKVFGGKISPRWPAGGKPEWLRDELLLRMGFAIHDFGESEAPYAEGVYPFGPNFWVRKEVFADGRRFSESIGPKGSGRLMGSETLFLQGLKDAGFDATYIPAVEVQHRIKESDLHLPNVYRRAESFGRGSAHIDGIDYHNLLSDRPFVWYLRQSAKLVVAKFRFFVAVLTPLSLGRVDRMVRYRIDNGRISEAFKLAKAFRRGVRDNCF